MVTWPQMTHWLLVCTLLEGFFCYGGEPTRKPDIPLPLLECQSNPEAGSLGGDRQAAVLDPIFESFKIATDGGPLLLPIELQGKRYWFVLDTGTSVGCYDTSLRSLLGRQIRVEKIWTPDRDLTVPVFRSPKGLVGKLALPIDSECCCMDLRKLREVSGQEFYGFLGMDFLRKHALRIDFDRGEVTFLRTIGNNPGERIPILFRGNDPYVLVEARGLVGQGRFLVDTGYVGFASGGLQAGAFTILNKRGFLTPENKAPTDSLAGSQKVRFGCVDTIVLGGFSHKKLVFTESNNRNVLGLGYLSRYVVTFDFPNGVMYLKKGRQFDRPELRNKSGLDIRRRNGETIVESVAEGSSSALAGVKPQDVLLKVHNARSSDMSLWSIRRLLCEKGKKYRLLVRRGEKKMELDIHLLD